MNEWMDLSVVNTAGAVHTDKLLLSLGSCSLPRQRGKNSCVLRPHPERRENRVWSLKEAVFGSNFTVQSHGLALSGPGKGRTKQVLQPVLTCSVDASELSLQAGSTLGHGAWGGQGHSLLPSSATSGLCQCRHRQIPQASWALVSLP